MSKAQFSCEHCTKVICKLFYYAILCLHMYFLDKEHMLKFNIFAIQLILLSVPSIRSFQCNTSFLLLKYDFLCCSVEEIKAVLWYMQKNLASFRWWELGEIFFVLILVFEFLAGKLEETKNLSSRDILQVCCDGCDVWVHVECTDISSNALKVIFIFSFFLI